MWECPLCGERSQDTQTHAAQEAAFSAETTGSSLDASYVVLGAPQRAMVAASSSQALSPLREDEDEDVGGASEHGAHHTGLAAVLGRAARLRRCSHAPAMECGACATCIHSLADSIGSELAELNRERLAYVAAMERCRSQTARLGRNYDAARPSAEARAQQLRALDDALALSMCEVRTLRDALRLTQRQRGEIRSAEREVMHQLLGLQREKLRAREESEQCVAAYKLLIEKARHVGHHPKGTAEHGAAAPTSTTRQRPCGGGERERHPAKGDPMLDASARASAMSSVREIEDHVARVCRELQPPD
jgi:hypothetical protein